MSDTLYLSLWYPNLRLASLADKLVAVLGEFARHGGEPTVYASTAWPVNWSEPPVFQRVYGHGKRGAEPRVAVEDTLEMLHDDYAYEFQIGWSLWELEGGDAGPSTPSAVADSAQDDSSVGRRSAHDDSSVGRGFAQDELRSDDSHPSHKNKNVARVGHPGQDDSSWDVRSTQDDRALMGGLDARWVREPRLVRVTGYGPLFDEGTYEADGHIRIDFGTDAAFLEEGIELDSQAARHMAENVRQLVELTAAVEKASGATARLLWSELGESLAQRLAARLGGLN